MVLLPPPAPPLPPARVSTGGLGRVDSLPRVHHVRHVARVPGHCVRHLGTEIFLIYNSKYFCAAVSHSDLLQAAVWQVDEVLALGVVAVPRLAGAVVVLGVVVSHPDIKRITYHRAIATGSCDPPVCEGVDRRLVRVTLHGVGLGPGLGEEDAAGEQHGLELRTKCETWKVLLAMFLTRPTALALTYFI